MNYNNGQSCCDNGNSYCGCGNQYPVVPGTNHALQTWNGSNFVVADGSNQNPITLNALRVIPSGDAQFLIACDSVGKLAYSSVEGSPIGAAYLNNDQTFTATNTFTQPIIGNIANISNGATGQLVYQADTNVTSFINNGIDGQVLITHPTTAPTWENQNTLVVGGLSGGTAGSLPYQSQFFGTQFTASGTSGYILQSNGTSAPSWTNYFSGNSATATTAAFSSNSTLANNLKLGIAGQIPYQNAPNATAFTSVGGTGNVLTSGGTSAPTWTVSTNANTASAIVQRDSSGNFTANSITARNTAKAYYSGTVSGTTLTQTVAYGVTVVRTSVGLYTATLSPSSSAYSIVVSIGDTTSKTIYYTVNVVNSTTFTIKTYALTVSGAALVQTANDVASFNFAVYGS